ncbi:hypothetical protein Salat_0340500 [Sesamum alatum]|uniref:Uncharacterized protein n=1 Tax=Sesamum alatum TaxID=300844 RepID=A0AAE1Z288_9LAMI|nr:hypothetical protein Salat_0340500 [Sesamum alatum]
MEKRQLDFNAPLLSVRRYSSPSKSSELVKRKVTEKPVPSRQQSLPTNKSDLEHEQVTRPVAVPFHWEQIPGRPKSEVESQVHTPEEPSNTPRLPPARVSDAIRRSSGEIPKLPPGRLSGPLRYSSGERCNDQNLYRPQVEAFSFNDHAILLERLNESLKCKDESDSESGDDAYSDALETLSPTESGSMNYSVSGLSDCHSSDVKPSGTFCIDKQTRDLMMNRFLPAAKAVVLETPQYAVKKSPVIDEPPKQVKKVVSGEIKPSLKQYSSDALPYYSRYIDNAESEDEDQEYSVPVKKSGKAWRILPRFCVKNSLCLLNPLPAMKSRSRAPTPPKADVRRLTRNAHSGPLDKQNACRVPYKKKFHSGLLSRDLPALENKLTDDISQFVNTRDSHSSGVSPLRRYRSGSISPYRNESPKSPFREGVGFLGVPKQVANYNADKIATSRKLFKALQDVSRNQINERGSGPTVDVVEKTLYVDYVKKTDLPISKSSCTKADDGLVKSSGERLKVLAGSRQMEDNYALKPDQDASCLNTTEEEKRPSPKSGLTEKVHESKNLECNEVAFDVKFGTKEERNVGSDSRRQSDPPFKSPLPPPLPKSPSESWLWRTLPSISLGNPFGHSREKNHLHSKKQGQKGSATDTKWETIVKTSNIRPDHVRYSEELIPHASRRQSKHGK